MQQWRTHRSTVLAISALVAAAIVGPLAGSAGAAATPTTATTPTAATSAGLSIPFSDLGIGSSLTINGIAGTQTIDIPIPDGLTPNDITGTVDLSIDANVGEIEFADGTDRLDVVPIDNRQSTVPISFIVPLEGATVTNGVLPLTITTEVKFPATYCRGQYTIPSIDLNGLAIDFTGVPTAPTTIADFFGPILNQLNIWLPPHPSAALTQAALTLSATTATDDLGQPLTISVKKEPSSGLPDPGPYDPVARDVVFEPGSSSPAPSVQVVGDAAGDPLLVLNDSPGQLQAAINIVTGHLAGLVQAVGATLGGSYAGAVIPPLQQTVAQLGVNPLETSGEGRVEISAPFSQSTFGGMVKDATLYLNGDYTPVPTDADASLAVLFNNTIVKESNVSHSSSFNFRIPIPTWQLERDNTVTVQAEFIPHGGICSSTAFPIDLRLNPDSSISVTLGTSLNPGFDRLPQALLPTVGVSLRQDTLTDIGAACSIINALGRQSADPLSPVLLRWSEAGRSTLPLLAVSSATEAPVGITPLVDLATPTGLVEDHLPHDIDVGTLGALAQVVTTTKARTELLVNATTPSNLGSLISGITTPTAGIDTYGTDTVVLTADGNVRTVQVGNVAYIGPAPAPTKLPLWALPSVAALVVLAGAGVLLLWRRRRHRHQRES